MDKRHNIGKIRYSHMLPLTFLHTTGSRMGRMQLKQRTILKGLCIFCMPQMASMGSLPMYACHFKEGIMRFH